ncbi:TetR/AcrR family transcriptional regulator [Actinomadura flavalba]|uniref:TetR/AcrR family transcriptional regulator n=1 Tax=Actinomadura flavalba TaxID=1120938 RepID=UPI0003A0C896|nr:TetR/AcrR family transcriptional regulator [Actinomadura flavalba]
MSAATPDVPPRPRRRRMSRAERERQMLDVAKELFGEHGYHAASMDEIARRCGVSKPMIYEYFGSKEGLMLACLRLSQAELYEVTQKGIAGATTPRDILTRGMLAYFEFVGSNRRSFAMALAELAATPEAAAAVEEIRLQQSALIRDVLRTFASGAPDDHVAAFTEIIMGASERLALWQVRHADVTAEQAATYMSDFCWHGLSPYLADA